MEEKNLSPVQGNGNRKRSIFDQPRKAVSGMVFSGAVIGMLLISLVYSITLAAVGVALGKTAEELAQTEVYKYCTYLLYQLVYIGVVCAFMKIYKTSPTGFGWRKTGPKYLLLALPLAFGLLFSLNWANGLFVQFLELLGYQLPNAQYPELTEREYALIYQLPSLAGGGFVGVLIVVALLPAILEETLLRGVVLDGIKDIGTVAACLLGGLVFSLFHQNPPQTVYQFICGAVFTLFAIRADSLIPAVIVHFLNNAIIVFDYKFDFLSKVSAGGAIALYVVSAVCLVASLVYLIFFDKRTNRKKEGAIKPFIYPALPGIILCALMWILNFASGFGG